MILSTQSSYPQTQIYVVRLHIDSQPEHGRLMGRIEHVASGHLLHFGSAEELLACLARSADWAAAAGDVRAANGDGELQ